MVNGLEAVADAIMAFEGWKPGSRSYRNRNPGNLEHLGEYVVYPSMMDGYRALLNDLRAKFTGVSKHNLGPNATVLQLMNVYAPAEDHNDPESYAEFVIKWVSTVLGKPITLASKLSEIWSG